MSAELEETLQRLNTQLIINPRDSWMRYHQARALQRLGRWDEAVQSFERAIKLAPAMSEAHFHLGECRLAQDKPEDAAAAFHAAGAVKPEYREAFVAEAEVLLKLG